MSRQVLPILGAAVGAVVGWYVGGPSGAVSGAQYGFIAGSIAGPIVDPIVLQGNRVGDNQLQIAAEGGARAIVFGLGCVNSTCIIARGDRQVVKKKEGGGKGGGPKTENEYVYWTFAIGFGEALVGGLIQRVWQDENLVYDIRTDGQRSEADNSAFAAKFRFYDGSETQLPDPALQAFMGDDTPYFRGTAYVVFPSFDLTNTAERIPIFKFEVSSADATLAPSDIVSQLLLRVGMAPAEYDVTELDEVTETDTVWESRHIEAFNLDDYETVSGNAGLFTVTDNTLTMGAQDADIAAAIKRTLPEPVLFDRLTFQIETSVLNPDDAPTIRFDGVADIYFILARETYFDSNRRPLFHLNGSTFYLGSTQVAVGKTYTLELLMDADADTWEATLTKDEDGSIHGSASGSGGGSLSIEEISYTIDSGVLTTPVEMQPIGFYQRRIAAVSGVVLQETMSGADAVAAIIAAYFVDPAEYDGVLHFVKRGHDIVRVLTIDDLVEEPEVSTRENAVEYPAKLHLFYQSPQTGYATTKATSNRYSPNANVVGEGSVSVPITFEDSSEPANIAAKLHKVMWNEAGGDFAWTVGDHCLDLVPTDTLGLSLRGVVTRVRVTALDVQQGRLKLIMRKDRQSSYTADVEAIPLPAPTTPPPTTVSKAVLAVMDIPALVDSDDDLYYYTAMSGETQAWRGGQLQRSVDGGATWAAIGESPVNAPMGRLTLAITAADSAYPDNTNVVKVQLFDPNDEINDLTHQQWLSENGALAVEAADGSWELMQFRDATDEGDGLYTLSMLQRGRLNTPAVAHAVGGLVVVLDAALQRHEAGSAFLDTLLHHRAVSYGTSPELADDVETLFVGNSQREFPVVSFEASAVGSSVVVSNIIPRHRFGTEDVPVRSANWTGYRITAVYVRPSDMLNIITTMDTTETSAVMDVSILGGPVSTVRVAQINRLTGAGEAVSVLVEDTGDLDPYEATVEFDGIFTTGIDVSLTVGALVVGQHTIEGGDTDLDGVAIELAADVNANTEDTGYSAKAVGAIVEIDGPPGINFDMSTNFSGSSSLSASFVHSGAAAGPGSSYVAYYNVANFVTGATEPIPAGTTFSLIFQRPIYNTLGTVSFTTTKSASVREDVYFGLAAAAIINPGGALYALGYRLGTTITGGIYVGTIVGPMGETGLYVGAGTSGPFTLGVSVSNPGSEAVPVDRYQTVKYTVAGTPTVGETFAIVLQGVPFEFVAASTSASDVATGLAAVVDAHASYTASAVGAEVTVAGISTSQSFTFTSTLERAVTALTMLQYLNDGKRSRGFSPMIFATDDGKLYAYTAYYLGAHHGSDQYASRFWEAPDYDGPFSLKRTRIDETIGLGDGPHMLPGFGRIAQTATMALRFDGADTTPWNFSRTYFALTDDPSNVDSDLPSGAKPISMWSDGSRIVLLAADGKAYSTTDGETWTDLGAFTGSFPTTLAFNNCTLQKIGSRWFLITQNTGGIAGEVNSNVIFYNDSTDPVGAWTTAAGQPSYTRAPALNLHEEMASDGTNVYLFVNTASDVMVFVSADNGANWTLEATVASLVVNMVQVDTRGSPVKIRLHGAGYFSQKNVGTTSWSTIAANGLNSPFYGVVVGGHAIVSDNINGPFTAAEYVIKRDVNGVFSETLSGFEGLD